MEEVVATKIEDGEPISKHPLFGGQGIMQWPKGLWPERLEGGGREKVLKTVLGRVLGIKTSVLGMSIFRSWNQRERCFPEGTSGLRETENMVPRHKYPWRHWGSSFPQRVCPLLWHCFSIWSSNPPLP